jgi:Arc/MetJ family transcription regulator
MGIVKTTVDIDDDLFKTARKRAIDEGRPFRAVLNDALRAHLGAPGVATPEVRRSAGRRGSPGHTAAPRRTRAAAAEFWAIVNDRSRWDELFKDRSRQIEAQIADATARWSGRARR